MVDRGLAEAGRQVTKDGDGYQRVRQAFGVLLVGARSSRCTSPARYVGGVYVNRSHKGDPKAADPYVVIEPKKQREALKLVEEQVFSDAPFEFPPSSVQPPGRDPLGALGNRGFRRATITRCTR